MAILGYLEVSGGVKSPSEELFEGHSMVGYPISRGFYGEGVDITLSGICYQQDISFTHSHPGGLRTRPTDQGHSMGPPGGSQIGV